MKVREEVRYTLKEFKMSEIKLQRAFRVDIMEYERGWGSKVDETKFFDNEQEARDFCKQYNAKNTATTVPDWYMVANYAGRVA
jgi:hypothetical protein